MRSAGLKLVQVCWGTMRDLPGVKVITCGLFGLVLAACDSGTSLTAASGSSGVGTSSSSGAAPSGSSSGTNLGGSSSGSSGSSGSSSSSSSSGSSSSGASPSGSSSSSSSGSSGAGSSSSSSSGRVSSGGSSSGSSSSSSGSSSSSSSSSGGALYLYIAYQASPTSGTAGGTTGLFVIPSDNLSAQPLFVTTDSGSSLAAIYQFSLNSAGYITGYTPFGIVYNDLLQQHLYRLDLGIQSGNAPALVQMSTLSFSQTKVCEMSIIVRTNFTDPLTTAFIFRVAANGSPCGAADQFLMVHYTDSATTAPVTVPSAPMGAIYNSDGSLAGLLALDASGNLKFSTVRAR